MNSSSYYFLFFSQTLGAVDWDNQRGPPSGNSRLRRWSDFVLSLGDGGEAAEHQTEQEQAPD